MGRRPRGRGNETQRVAAGACGSRSWPQAPRLGAVALRWPSGLRLKSGPQGQLNETCYSLPGTNPACCPERQRPSRRRSSPGCCCSRPVLPSRDRAHDGHAFAWTARAELGAIRPLRGRRLLSRPGHRTHGHRPTFDALDHAQPPAAADNGSRAPARPDVPLHRVIPQRSATRARSTAAPLRRASAIVGTLPRRPALRARRSARRGCRHLPGPPGRNYRSPPARRPARLPSSPSAKILARRDDAHRVRGQGFLGAGAVAARGDCTAHEPPPPAVIAEALSSAARGPVARGARVRLARDEQRRPQPVRSAPARSSASSASATMALTISAAGRTSRISPADCPVNGVNSCGRPS
jgi:hypothetical protein